MSESVLTELPLELAVIVMERLQWRDYAALLHVNSSHHRLVKSYLSLRRTWTLNHHLALAEFVLAMPNLERVQYQVTSSEVAPATVAVQRWEHVGRLLAGTRLNCLILQLNLDTLPLADFEACVTVQFSPSLAELTPLLLLRLPSRATPLQLKHNLSEAPVPQRVRQLIRARIEHLVAVGLFGRGWSPPLDIFIRLMVGHCTVCAVDCLDHSYRDSFSLLSSQANSYTVEFDLSLPPAEIALSTELLIRWVLITRRDEWLVIELVNRDCLGVELWPELHACLLRLVEGQPRVCLVVEPPRLLGWWNQVDLVSQITQQLLCDLWQGKLVRFSLLTDRGCELELIEQAEWSQQPSSTSELVLHWSGLNSQAEITLPARLAGSSLIIHHHIHRE